MFLVEIVVSHTMLTTTCLYPNQDNFKDSFYKEKKKLFFLLKVLLVVLYCKKNFKVECENVLGFVQVYMV